MNNSHSN